MAMIKCRICGRNISDTEKVCPYCEEKIEKMINCPKCGSEEVDFSLVGKTSVFKCKSCHYRYTVNQSGVISDYIGAKEEDFNIFTAFISMYKKMFNFKGRSRRKEYWLATLSHVIVDTVLSILLFVVSLADSSVGFFIMLPVFLVYGIAMGIGMLAMEIRRLHDTGRPWTTIFISLVPVVGRFVLWYFLIEDSQFGPNEYGPNPKWNNYSV